MNILDEYATLIKTKFPIHIRLNEHLDTAFSDEGVLFKSNHDNTYCYAELSKSYAVTGLVFVSIFKSDWKSFERVEGDYLEWAIRFSFRNIEGFKSWMHAV